MSPLTVGSDGKPRLPFSHDLLHVVTECHQIVDLAIKQGQLLTSQRLHLPAWGAATITHRQDLR